MLFHGKILFYRQFHVYNALTSKSVINERKQVISGNDADGPQLPTNAVSVTQRISGCDCLSAAVKLVFLPVFVFYNPTKWHLDWHSNDVGSLNSHSIR